MSTALTMHGISENSEWTKLQTAPWGFLSFKIYECCLVAPRNSVTCNTDHGLVKLSQGCLCKKYKFTLLTKSWTTSNFNNLLPSHGLMLGDLEEFWKVKARVKGRVQGQIWMKLKELPINFDWVICYTNLSFEKSVSLVVRPSMVHLWYLWCLVFTWQTECSAHLIKTDQGV